MEVTSVLTRIRTSAYARRIFLLAGSTTMAQLINFLASFILTRLYSPADYGVFALFLSFVSIAGLLSTLCLEYGIVGADETRATSLFCLSILICAGGSIFAAGVFLLLHYLDLFSYGHLASGYAPFVLLSTFAIGSFSIARFWAIRREQFKVISRVTVTRNLLRAGIQMLTPLLKTGPLGLITGELVGRTAGNFAVVRHDYRKIAVAFRRLGPKHYFRLFRKNRNYPLYLMPSQLITTVSLMLPAVLFVRSFGAQEGGYFSFVLTIVAVPVSLVTGSISDVFHQRMSVAGQEREQLFFNNLKPLLLIGLVACAAMYFLSPHLFPLLFGIKWAEAGQVASALSFLMLGQLVVIPLSRVVYVFKKERQKLIYDIVAFSSVIAPFLLKAPLEMDFIRTVWLFSLLRSGSYFLYLMILIKIIRDQARNA